MTDKLNAANASLADRRYRSIYVKQATAFVLLVVACVSAVLGFGLH